MRDASKAPAFSRPGEVPQPPSNLPACPPSSPAAGVCCSLRSATAASATSGWAQRRWWPSQQACLRTTAATGGRRGVASPPSAGAAQQLLVARCPWRRQLAPHSSPGHSSPLLCSLCAALMCKSGWGSGSCCLEWWESCQSLVGLSHDPSATGGGAWAKTNTTGAGCCGVVADRAPLTQLPLGSAPAAAQQAPSQARAAASFTHAPAPDRSSPAGPSRPPSRTSRRAPWRQRGQQRPSPPPPPSACCSPPPLRPPSPSPTSWS